MILLLLSQFTVVKAQQWCDHFNDKGLFILGEEIYYKVKFGFVSAGEAKIIVSDNFFEIEDQPCIKIDVYGISTGLFDLFMHVDDQWGTYLDTTCVLPKRSYRILQEGNYRKHEFVNFNHTTLTAEYSDYDYSKEKWKKVEYFSINEGIQDMVSGYYLLRNMNLDKYVPGDIFRIEGFFEGKIYNFPIRVIKKEVLNTKLGKINSVKLAPIMPENSLFDGEDSVEFWVGLDDKRLPLKIKAKLFIGHLEVSISEYLISPD